MSKEQKMKKIIILLNKIIRRDEFIMRELMMLNNPHWGSRAGEAADIFMKNILEKMNDA